MRKVKVVVVDGVMFVIEHDRVTHRDVMALNIKVNGDLDVSKVEPNTEEVLAMLGFPPTADATEGPSGLISKDRGPWVHCGD